MAGTLILAANSLGNPQDIPQRTLEAVRNADHVVFEEDRPGRVVLKAAGVTRSYWKFNEHDASQEILLAIKKALQNNKCVVYVSDQGCPSLADPGGRLAQLAQEMQAKVVVIPGPSSVTAALSACTFPTDRYVYVGFLAKDEGRRRQDLEFLGATPFPLVILDTPYRLLALLSTCAALWPARRGFIALDISGPEEHYRTGRFSDLVAEAQKNPSEKLNFVLIVSGAEASRGKAVMSYKPRGRTSR